MRGEARLAVGTVHARGQRSTNSKMIFLMDLQMMLLDMIYFILRSSVRTVLRPRTKPIDGELVLITGAGGGLGRLFAQEFAKHGAEVVLWDVDGGANEQTAKLAREMGVRVHTYTVDVTSREEVYRCAALVRQDAGRDVTMLVNNAGVVAGKRMLDCPDELMERTMKVNCHALFWVRTSSQLFSERTEIIRGSQSVFPYKGDEH